MYDVETFNKFRNVHYAIGIYKLRKILKKHNQDISEKEYQKCLNDCTVFRGTDCNNKMLDHVLSFKGENKKSKIRLLNFFNGTQSQWFR